MKILILAALKQEIKYLLKEKELRARESGKGTWLAGPGTRNGGKAEIAIVLTGMGVANAAVRAGNALLAHAPSLVISAGFAGALYEGAEYGELVCPEMSFLHRGESLHPGLHPAPGGLELCGRRFEGLFGTASKKAAAKRGSIITLSQWVEKPAIKDLLGTGLQYPVCDMETFPVAKAVLENGAEFFALRSITDRAGEEIGLSPLEIADTEGQISMGKAAWRFISSPRLIPRAVKFSGSSDKAARALASALKELLLSL